MDQHLHADLRGRPLPHLRRRRGAVGRQAAMRGGCSAYRWLTVIYMRHRPAHTPPPSPTGLPGSRPRTVSGVTAARVGLAPPRRLARAYADGVPRYEYRCRACGATFEQTRPISESSAPCSCPRGHDDTVKLLSTVSVGGRSSYPRPGWRRLLRWGLRLPLSRPRADRRRPRSARRALSACRQARAAQARQESSGGPGRRGGPHSSAG